MKKQTDHEPIREVAFGRLAIRRRAFLKQGSLILAAGVMSTMTQDNLLAAEDEEENPSARIGLLTDVHYADRDPAGTRHYREGISKVSEAVAVFNQRKATAAIHLGDFIDTADDTAGEIAYLKRIEAEFARFRGDRHYVLGNHCVWTLTKQEFLDNSAARKAHYSFDHGGFHFVILDACYRDDGVPYGRKNFEWTDTNIPAAELEWLTADLGKTKLPAIVCAHQRLDVGQPYGIRNAPAVRKVLEQSEKVSLVLTGHSHENEYRQLAGIHYCTLAAVVEGSGVENNAYSLLQLYKDGSLRIDGFRKQQDRGFG